MRTRYDSAIWYSHKDGETYAFPLGSHPDWGVGQPTLDETQWQAKGTLPKGAEVSDLKRFQNSRVRCTLAGMRNVNTPDWNVDS